MKKQKKIQKGQFESGLKSSKGITLIALVITIIVLIILASVSIAMVLGDNGLAQTAKKGAQNYQLSAEEEQTVLTNLLEQVEKNTGGNTEYNEYDIGQEVTVGNGANAQHFYVLETSGTTEREVILLAKYNLNPAGTAQAPNESMSDTACKFSDTNYWATALSSYTDWSTEKLDINTISGEVEGDAIYKAKAYAKIVSGDNNNNSGRLLTYEEADALRASYPDMIWGRANQQGEGSSDYYLHYWLSSAVESASNNVWFVHGRRQYLNFDRNSRDTIYRGTSSY